MDTYENDEYQTPDPELQETPSQPEEVSGAYHGTGSGRKESPYANSPYVMDQPQQEYHYQPQNQPPQKPHREHKPRKPIWKGLIACLLAVVLVAGGCLITASTVNARWEARSAQTEKEFTEKIEQLQKQIDSANTSKNTIQTLPASGSGLTPSQLYSGNVDSVVAISSTVQATSIYGTSQGTSSGSGFVWSAEGYVVTNYHVVQNATNVKVITYDSTEYPAEIVGYDATNDIAVLKVEAEGLRPVTIGSSSALNIGDMVAAIGNPLGTLASTQTVGYVSGMNREVTTDNAIISMIQTDCAINPGNSGGPLFNMNGEVIGITTAKYSGTTTSGASIEGIGFAIPIDDVKPIVEDLINYGYVTGAYMGVTVENTDAESAAKFGLPTGAYIVDVVKGGAADRAGIQPKDIVIDLGGNKVSNITDLTRALRNFKAGDTTTVTLIRSGKEMTLDITLDEKPQETTIATTPNSEPSDSSMPSEGDYNDWFNWFFGGRNGG